MRQQEQTLRCLEAIIGCVTAAGQHVKAEIVQIEDVALLQTICDVIQLAGTPKQAQAFYRGG
jgi:hypothetical protein